MGKIDELTPSQLDALIAEHIMGLKVHWREIISAPGHGYAEAPYYIAGHYLNLETERKRIDWQSIPNYSMLETDAFKVVQKLKENKMTFVLEDYQFDGKKWQALFKGEFDEEAGRWTAMYYAFAETAALAICRAALKVVGYEQD